MIKIIEEAENATFNIAVSYRYFSFERRTSTMYYIVASFCNFSTLFQRSLIKNQRRGVEGVFLCKEHPF